MQISRIAFPKRCIEIPWQLIWLLNSFSVPPEFSLGIVNHLLLVAEMLLALAFFFFSFTLSIYPFSESNRNRITVYPVASRCLILFRRLQFTHILFKFRAVYKLL